VVHSIIDMRISLARRFAKHTQALQLLPQIQIQQ
jgi:hypothetical protein